jgi:hypothetical protein
VFLQILAVIAEFEASLIRQRTREGMEIARQNGKLRGKQSRLKPAHDREIRRMHDSSDYDVAEIAALFSVSSPTVYRSLNRTAELPPTPGPCLMSPSTTSCPPQSRTTVTARGSSPQEHLVACNSHRLEAAALRFRCHPGGSFLPDGRAFVASPVPWSSSRRSSPVIVSVPP